MISASKDSTIKLWTVKNTKKATYTLPGHEDEVYALDWYLLSHHLSYFYYSYIKESSWLLGRFRE